jgi:hypothetical protein
MGRDLELTRITREAGCGHRLSAWPGLKSPSTNRVGPFLNIFLNEQVVEFMTLLLCKKESYRGSSAGWKPICITVTLNVQEINLILPTKVEVP